MRFKNLALEIVIAEGDKVFTTVLRQQKNQVTDTLEDLYNRYIESRYFFVNFDFESFDVQTPLDFYFGGEQAHKILFLFCNQLLFLGWKPGKYEEVPASVTPMKSKHPKKPDRPQVGTIVVESPKGLSRKKKKAFQRSKTIKNPLQILQGDSEIKDQGKTQYSLIRLWNEHTEVYLHQYIPLKNVIPDYKIIFLGYIHLMPNKEEINSISFFFERLSDARRFVTELILELGWIDPYDVDQKCPGLLEGTGCTQYHSPDSYKDNNCIPF